MRFFLIASLRVLGGVQVSYVRTGNLSTGSIGFVDGYCKSLDLPYVSSCKQLVGLSLYGTGMNQNGGDSLSPSIYLSVYLSVCLSVCPSISPSVRPSIHPSISHACTYACTHTVVSGCRRTLTVAGKGLR